jgi:hypothetical protein
MEVPEKFLTLCKLYMSIQESDSAKELHCCNYAPVLRHISFYKLH